MSLFITWWNNSTYHEQAVGHLAVKFDRPAFFPLLMTVITAVITNSSVFRAIMVVTCLPLQGNCSALR